MLRKNKNSKKNKKINNIARNGNNRNQKNETYVQKNNNQIIHETEEKVDYNNKNPKSKKNKNTSFDSYYKQKYGRNYKIRKKMQRSKSASFLNARNSSTYHFIEQARNEYLHDKKYRENITHNKLQIIPKPNIFYYYYNQNTINHSSIQTINNNDERRILSKQKTNRIRTYKNVYKNVNKNITRLDTNEILDRYSKMDDSDDIQESDLENRSKYPWRKRYKHYIHHHPINPGNTFNSNSITFDGIWKSKVNTNVNNVGSNETLNDIADKIENSPMFTAALTNGEVLLGEVGNKQIVLFQDPNVMQNEILSPILTDIHCMEGLNDSQNCIQHQLNKCLNILRFVESSDSCVMDDENILVVNQMQSILQSLKKRERVMHMVSDGDISENMNGDVWSDEERIQHHSNMSSTTLLGDDSFLSFITNENV